MYVLWIINIQVLKATATDCWIVIHPAWYFAAIDIKACCCRCCCCSTSEICLLLLMLFFIYSRECIRGYATELEAGNCIFGLSTRWWDINFRMNKHLNESFVLLLSIVCAYDIHFYWRHIPNEMYAYQHKMFLGFIWTRNTLCLHSVRIISCVLLLCAYT